MLDVKDGPGVVDEQILLGPAHALEMHPDHLCADGVEGPGPWRRSRRLPGVDCAHHQQEQGKGDATRLDGPDLFSKGQMICHSV